MPGDDPTQDIKDVAEVFNERDRQFHKISQSPSHKRWSNKPIADNKLVETRHYDSYR